MTDPDACDYCGGRYYVNGATCHPHHWERDYAVDDMIDLCADCADALPKCAEDLVRFYWNRRQPS